MTFSYGPVPDDLLATAQQWREKMVSAAAEASDELMDTETGELDEAEIVAGLRQRTVKGRSGGAAGAPLKQRRAAHARCGGGADAVAAGYSGDTGR